MVPSLADPVSSPRVVAVQVMSVPPPSNITPHAVTPSAVTYPTYSELLANWPPRAVILLEDTYLVGPNKEIIPIPAGTIATEEDD